MNSAFVSYHFSDEDRPLVTHVERLLASHGVFIRTGNTLGGGPLAREVLELIEAADGLVALMTRRDALAGGTEYTTHPWVTDEYNHARSIKKPAIALVEAGVRTGGAYQEHERIPLDRANLVPALLKLSETIGKWKRDAGRTLMVRIRPDDTAARMAADDAACEYRLWVRDRASDWRPATLIPEGEGTFVYVQGVKDDTRVQVRVKWKGTDWHLTRIHQQWAEVILPPAGK
jgi:hypothetical protein